MHLSEEEIDTLKNGLRELDADARLYQFGSRVDDSKRGGDIDLLIISRKLDKKQLRKIRRKFYDRFGEQKMDLVIDNGEMCDPFVREIMRRREVSFLTSTNVLT